MNRYSAPRAHLSALFFAAFQLCTGIQFAPLLSIKMIQKKESSMKNVKLTVAALLLTTFMSSGLAHADMNKSPMDDSTSPNYTGPKYIGPDYHHYRTIQDTDRMNKPDQEQQQSMTQDNTSHEDKTIRDEVFGIAPELGALSFTNRNGAYSSRAMAGVGLNFNLVPLVMDRDNRDWYMGVSTGALYSHMGSDSGNFFGSNSNVQSTDNSNVLIIPADLKIGYNLSSAFRLSAHGGGNIIYRSVGNAIDLGSDSNTNDSLWRIYPNAGADAEWQVGKNVSLMLRPDLTFTSGTTLFGATLGATLVNL
jgi:hypothetical protein